MLINASAVVLAGLFVALFSGMAGTFISVQNQKKDIAAIKINQKSFGAQLAEQRDRQLVLETRFLDALGHSQQHETGRPSMVNKVNR